MPQCICMRLQWLESDLMWGTSEIEAVLASTTRIYPQAELAAENIPQLMLMRRFKLIREALAGIVDVNGCLHWSEGAALSNLVPELVPVPQQNQGRWNRIVTNIVCGRPLSDKAPTWNSLVARTSWCACSPWREQSSLESITEDLPTISGSTSQWRQSEPRTHCSSDESS